MALVIDCMTERQFFWIKAAIMAFEVIKGKLIITLVLAILNFSLIFEVQCDASKICIEVVFSQQSKPRAYFSEDLNGAKGCYNTYDIEFYAVVQALTHWRHSNHKDFI